MCSGRWVRITRFVCKEFLQPQFSILDDRKVVSGSRIFVWGELLCNTPPTSTEFLLSHFLIAASAPFTPSCPVEWQPKCGQKLYPLPLMPLVQLKEATSFQMNFALQNTKMWKWTEGRWGQANPKGRHCCLSCSWSPFLSWPLWRSPPKVPLSTPRARLQPSPR